MSTSTTGRASRRSRITRFVALAVGALSVVGVAVVGTTATASAEEQHRQVKQRDQLCVQLSARGEFDRDCGRRVNVEVDRRATSVGIMSEHRRTCVIANRERDCERGWSRVNTRRGFDEVRFYVEDLNVCGRAASDRDWGRVSCSNRRGWLTLEADDDIDSISLWIQRRQTRH